MRKRGSPQKSPSYALSRRVSALGGLSESSIRLRRHRPQELRQRRASLEDEIQRIEWALAHGMPRRLSLDPLAAAISSPRGEGTGPSEPGPVAVAVSAAAMAASPDVMSRLEARALNPCISASSFRPSLQNVSGAVPFSVWLQGNPR